MFSSETHCLFFYWRPLSFTGDLLSFLLETPYFYRRLIVFFHWWPLIITGDSLSFFIEDPLFLPETHCLFYWRPLIFAGDSLSFFIEDLLFLSETHCLFSLETPCFYWSLIVFFIRDPLFLSETHRNFSLETPYFYRRLIVFFIGDPLFYRRLIDFLFLLKTPWFRRKPIFHWKPLLCSGITFSMRVLLYFNWRRSPLVFSHEKLGLVGSLWNKKQLKKKTLMESLWMWFNRSTQIKLKRLWKLSNVFKTSLIYYN